MPVDNNRNGILKNAHEAAFSKAKKKMPKIDINDLIKYGMRVMDGDDPKDIAFEFAGRYKNFAYAYTKEFAQKAINEGLKTQDNQIFQNLSNENIGKALVALSPKVLRLVQKYLRHELSPEDFLKELYCKEATDVAFKVLRSIGIDETNIGDPANLMKMSCPMLAYNASIAAYKELRRAMDDLSIAQEERARIEAQCNESIQMIRKYREEMNARIEKYLSKHHETFQQGFAMMDQAILEDDVDGYIRGNNLIQEILGYENIQFHNQKEFEELMESDEDFIL